MAICPEGRKGRPWPPIPPEVPADGENPSQYPGQVIPNDPFLMIPPCTWAEIILHKVEVTKTISTVKCSTDWTFEASVGSRYRSHHLGTVNPGDEFELGWRFRQGPLSRTSDISIVCGGYDGLGSLPSGSLFQNGRTGWDFSRFTIDSRNHAGPSSYSAYTATVSISCLAFVTSVVNAGQFVKDLTRIFESRGNKNVGSDMEVLALGLNLAKRAGLEMTHFAPDMLVFEGPRDIHGIVQELEKAKRPVKE